MVRWWSERARPLEKRSCLRRINSENSVGKCFGREAVHLFLDDCFIDVKPFSDTVVRVHYSSGFSAGLTSVVAGKQG